MKTMIRGAALATLTLATAARAADQGREWSLGAGVSFAELFSFSSTQSLTGALPISTPVAVANLERRLDRKLWLTLGVEGSAAKIDTSPATTTNNGASFNSTSNVVSFGVSPGLRKIVTPDDAPIEVSVLGEVQLGFSRSSFGVENTTSGSTAHGLHAGLQGGFAVERHLLDGLSVRAAARLLSAGYDRVTSDSTGASSLKTEEFSVAFFVSPSLELRFAF